MWEIEIMSKFMTNENMWTSDACKAPLNRSKQIYVTSYPYLCNLRQILLAVQAQVAKYLTTIFRSKVKGIHHTFQHFVEDR